MPYRRTGRTVAVEQPINTSKQPINMDIDVLVGEGADAFRETARAADHLLRQRVALHGNLRRRLHAELRGGREAKGLAGAGGETPPDDEGDAAAGLDLVEEDLGLEGPLADDLRCEWGGGGGLDERMCVCTRVYPCVCVCVCVCACVWVGDTCVFVVTSSDYGWL
jgi:hypothetical protein